jgi:hypothetical protein
VKAFVVRVNGKRLYTAGVGPDGVLTAIVNWVGSGSESDFGFHVGGLDSRTGEHLNYTTPQLRIGDKVSVEIIEAKAVDPEAQRYVPDLSGGG